ncbi:MAG: hypothetical protein IKW18_05320 [Clostridia bacterium]|nr:hypothetical protein [Clostridia bacterium]
MKKIIALLLAVWMLFSLTGCSEGMTSAENFLLAVKKMDFEAMKNELVPDQKLGSLYLKLDSDVDETALSALKNLYALAQYTIGEISEEGSAEKTVEVTLKIPDMERIREQARAKVMVSAETAEKIVGDMIADGSISKTMIVESTFSVKMVKTEDGWKIPYAENKDLAKALSIENMIEFFVKY